VNEGGKAILLTGDSDGDVTRGYAIDGGKTPDFFNSMMVKRDGGEFQVRAHRQAELLDGDIVIQKTAGGCGVGDPFTRDPESVLEDVQNGYVSIERAARDYGVVIDPASLKIDAHKTNQLRGGTASKPATQAQELVGSK
jgi:N-methylhydantoinase B